jgi:hypothetical protein
MTIHGSKEPEGKANLAQVAGVYWERAQIGEMGIIGS